MTRLFLQLFAPVFIVTSLFLFNINNLLNPLFSAFLEDQGLGAFKPIVLILDDTLAKMGGSKGEDKNRQLQQLQELFLFDIELLDFHNVHLPQEAKNSLEQGHFVPMPDNEDVLYHLSADTSHVWRLDLTQRNRETDVEFLRRLTAGPIRIITDNLLASPERKWHQALKTMGRKYDLTLSLLTLDTLDIKPQEVEKLNKQGVIIFFNNDLERIYSLIPDSDYVLKMGPFEYPLIIKFADQVFLGMLAFLMGFLVWLLLRPVWRDLRKLQVASRSFGQGQLQTRIKYSKRSTVKNILHAFNAMASRIQQLIASHQELTRAVSHELRTPVSRLRFSLEMLKETNDPADRKRFLQEMNTDIEELDEMLAELLSYARMEANQQVITYAPVVLTDWLFYRTIVYERDCHGKEIKVSHAKLPTEAVSCMDPKLMARALNNLFQNACRYAARNIHIDFTRTDEEYCLSVDDDGPGIPEEEYDTIFTPFTRLNQSRDRKLGGYGLGLAIVRQIAEAHQGTIEVIPSKLGGTTFLLKFPCETVSYHRG